MMVLRRLLLTACCCLPAGLLAAQPAASVSGFVTDQSTGETLLLANVIIEGTTTGTATNNSGYYTLTGLAPGSYTLRYSFISYRDELREVTLEPGEQLRMDVALQPAGVEFEEVVVTAERDAQEEVRRIGVSQLETDLVKKLPAVLEPDVFRSLQLLPGVKAASDFSSGLYIRGGNPGQTLILLDRTAVYNPSHFFGLFSTFNPDAIKDVRLYKGGYPAEYGGRLGSVVDIYNKDGNRVATHGSVSVGLLASRVLLEGPYPKGSWMIAARRSTLDPLLRILNNQGVDNVPESFYFYDLNGKFNFDAGTNDRFSLAFYSGIDDLGFPFLDDARLDLNYGNRTLSANWTHIFSNRLFSNFTATGSRYSSDPRIRIAGTPISQRNQVFDYSVKGDFEYVSGERHEVKAGFWAGSLAFRLTNAFNGQETLNSEIRTSYASAYIQETFKPSPLWDIQGGLRLNYFAEGDFVRAEPRLSVEHRPAPAVRLQAGYGRYYQFLTLVTNEAFAGFDLWLTTDEGVPPAYGDQFVGGVKTRLGEGFHLDVEGYYRTMERLFELDPLLPDAAGLDYADVFQFGDGYAYGVETLLEKQQGRLNGFLAYTYGITRRRFPGLNGGDFYSPKYDRTHDLNVVLNYKLSRKWRFTSVFTYATGQAYTEPLGQYRTIRDPFGRTGRNVLVTSFNNARLPAYHRLDAGFSKIGGFFGIGEYELQLQVVNAYARRNIWFYLNEREGDRIERTEVPQIPFPIPNVAFTLTF